MQADYTPHNDPSEGLQEGLFLLFTHDVQASLLNNKKPHTHTSHRGHCKHTPLITAR